MRVKQVKREDGSEEKKRGGERKERGVRKGVTVVVVVMVVGHDTVTPEGTDRQPQHSQGRLTKQHRSFHVSSVGEMFLVHLQQDTSRVTAFFQCSPAASFQCSPEGNEKSHCR
ncbi:hypothetical protein E2C01_017436 [Portunus trituberculatus]|uniref:Uncharacterized protein n=1 Tax=Portunus trituberculatus TaxID=210409 RepID=A0A5B7DSV1_PORTR|nr:hypothetical protein [Portunus trituberculatus]